MTRQLNIALLGCGQVGTGLIKLLKQQSDFIEKRAEVKLVIKRTLVKNVKKHRTINPPGITSNIKDILDDKSINIVVELMGGFEPSRTYILKSLRAGKHIVTANKAVLAKHGREIMNAAISAGRNVYYEAAVCAGIPIIRSIKEGLLANHITLLMGIINGTTNYILTRMNEDNLSLDKALSEAQAKGFAEPDPTMDIQGFDSAHKLAILASLCFGINVTPDKIYTEGITKIDIEDIKNAREFGYVIKLLAIARQLENNKVELKVHPTMIPKIHPLASVRNEFNAVYLNGDAVGEMMFYGKGAGPFPTASALLSDIIELSTRTIPISKQFSSNWSKNSVIPKENTFSEHYLRFPILDKPGVIGKIATVLGRHNISIYGATASLVPTKRALGHVRVLTKKTKESEIQKALSEISRLSIMRGKPVVINIEE